MSRSWIECYHWSYLTFHFFFCTKSKQRKTRVVQSTELSRSISVPADKIVTKSMIPSQSCSTTCNSPTTPEIEWVFTDIPCFAFIHTSQLHWLFWFLVFFPSKFVLGWMWIKNVQDVSLDSTLKTRVGECIALSLCIPLFNFYFIILFFCFVFIMRCCPSV